MASPAVQGTLRTLRGKGDLKHQSFSFVRFDFLLDRKLEPWLLEVNMSPNMIPHDGEAHLDTQWRVQVLQQVAALAAGRPELVPSATRLTNIRGALAPMAMGEESRAFQELRQLCFNDPSWRWSCDVPAAKTPAAFHGDCACVGRLLRHLETKHYRCEELGPACGGVSFERTLGYAVDMRWYEDTAGGEERTSDSEQCREQESA